MKSLRLFSLLLALPGIFLCAATLRAVSVPLTLLNELPIERKLAHFTSGVPFPMGSVQTNVAWVLKDKDGMRIPLQAQVTATWRDGSVKWVLLDFQSSAGANSSTQVILETSPSREELLPEHKLQVKEDATKFIINTGRLQFEIWKNRFGILENLSLDNNGNGVLEESEKQRIGGLDLAMHVYSSSSTNKPTQEQIIKRFQTIEALKLQPPAEVAMEDEGPLRASFKISGWFHSEPGKPLVKYSIRLRAFAGATGVELDHTVTQLADGLKMLWVRDIGFALKTESGTSPGLTFGDTSHPESRTNLPVRLVQLEESRYQISDVTGAPRQGLKGSGWVYVTSTNHNGVMLSVKDFWQQFPKALAVHSNKIEAALYPAESPEPFDMDQGLAKTHELYVGFTTKAIRDTPLIGRFNESLFAAASPQWYADSKVFGDLAPYNFDLFPDYETLTEASGDGFIKRMAAGFRNWGDVYNGGEYKGKNSYMNLEYDVPHNFIVQFARTGLPKYLNAARRMALHQADIDTNHKTGWQWKHSPRHVEIQAEFGHTFTRGLLENYYLTGKRQTSEAAVELGTYFAKAIRNPRELGNERQIGWSLISLLPVYEATWDKKFFEPARHTVEQLIAGMEPTGKFQIRWDNRISFFNGIAATGFIYYHRATGDERVAEAALKVLDRTHGMLPEYAGRTLEALAWASQRTGDSRYLDHLKISYETTMARQITWNSMELSAPTIFTVHALPFLAKAGLVEPPARPLNLTPAQASTDNSMHLRRLPNATGTLYLEVTNKQMLRLVLVRKGAWKSAGEAKLFGPEGQLISSLEFPKEVGVWQRKALEFTPRVAGTHRLELRSERILNAKAGSYVTWDIATATPLKSVFNTADFNGLEFVTPYLYFLPDPNAEKIELEFTGEGEGFKKVTIIDSDGLVAGSAEAFIDLGDKSRHHYKVSAPIHPDQKKSLWKLSLLEVNLLKATGIKPWFSASEESYFEPFKPAAKQPQP